jgi:hypothetical protein
MRALLIALVASISCFSSPSRTAPAAPSQLARIDAARAAWTSSPGARQAVDYARSVHDALGAGAYQADPFRWQQDLPGAIGALDAATLQAGGDAAQLVAWRAVLLGDNAQPTDAVREYERSLELGPNYVAAAGLVGYYGRGGRVADVHAVCGETVRQLRDERERFDLMAACLQASNALTEESGMPWATADELAWFRAERARQQQVAAAEADATRQRELDDVRAERDRRMVGRLCRDECADTVDRCYADCGDVARDACEYGCKSREDRCLRECK